MVRKTKKKAPVRKAKTASRKTARKKPARKTARKPARKTVRKAARKPAPRRNRVSAFKALENAIEVGIADLDDVAVSLGLLGAVEPGVKTKKKTKKSRR